MTVRVQLDEENGTYELGDDIEGVFIAFASLPKTQADSRIASTLQAQDTPAAPAPTPAAPDSEQGEYRDNGDGTYTRESDGVIGTFGPSGFAARA
jgi:hypothetical protein